MMTRYKCSRWLIRVSVLSAFRAHAGSIVRVASFLATMCPFSSRRLSLRPSLLLSVCGLAICLSVVCRATMADTVDVTLKTPGLSGQAGALVFDLIGTFLRKQQFDDQ